MVDDMIGARITEDAPETPNEGFGAMGKPIPAWRRQAAYRAAIDMGLNVQEKRWYCVNRMANALERDQPHRAIAIGMEYVDLTGTYRLMAELLSAPKPRVRVPARRAEL